jgi:hypothetical protein
LLLVFNYQVNIPTIELNGKTLPAVELYLFELILGQHVEMLSKHPEPTRGPSKHNAPYIAYITACAALTNDVFNLSLRTLLKSLFLNFQLFRIGLECVLCPIDWFLVVDVQRPTVIRYFNDSLVTAEILHRFIQ